MTKVASEVVTDTSAETNSSISSRNESSNTEKVLCDTLLVGHEKEPLVIDEDQSVETGSTLEEEEEGSQSEVLLPQRPRVDKLLVEVSPELSQEESVLTENAHISNDDGSSVDSDPQEESTNGHESSGD